MSERASERGIDLVRIQMVKEKTAFSHRKIRNSEDAVAALSDYMSRLDREMFCVLNLAVDGKVINMNVVSIGSICSSEANPSEVFKSAILSNASAIIMLHNHPSGNLEPSEDDLTVTGRMENCGRLLGIKVIDHIIVAGQTGDYYSLKANDQMDQDLKVVENFLDEMVR